MHAHEKINYVEFPSKDLQSSKMFFETVFGWSFTDFSDEYTAFDCQGIEGGFYKRDAAASQENGSALVVLYSNDLEATMKKIQQAGGRIVKEIFSFPGGRRFHFCEPSGNELAVWSDKD